MSNSVFFQIGQCGNQLADSVWSSIRGRGLEAQCGAFVEGKVSSVCVDLEPRVLRRLKDADAKRQLYHAHHMLWSDSGAANNYAQGRCMANAAADGSRSLVEMIEDNAQSLARGMQWSSSVLFHSLAGGSGSGVSGALLNALCDVTRARSMCVCVAPLDSGETCTQSFNTVLCARDMLQHCDAVIMLDNDSLLKQAAAKQAKAAASSPGAVGGGGGGSSSSVGVSLSDANKAAAPPIVDLFCDVLSMPVKEVCVFSVHGLAHTLRCGSNPFVAAHHAAGVDVSWSDLSQRMVKQVKSCGQGAAAAAAAAYVRGGLTVCPDGALTPDVRARMTTGICAAAGCSADALAWREGVDLGGRGGGAVHVQRRSISVFTPHPKANAMLVQAAHKVLQLVAVGAYVHWCVCT